MTKEGATLDFRLWTWPDLHGPMKQLCLGVLCLLACRNPNSYQPFDPTMPDPPGPPVLVQPVNGWKSGDYAYPQDVKLGWQRVTGAQFYEIQFSWDSLFQSAADTTRKVYLESLTVSMQSYGRYYWRVRAASHYWNNYTDWSLPFHFELANPAR